VLTSEHAGKAISVRLNYVDNFGATESIRSTATLAVKPINRLALLRKDTGKSGTTAFNSNQLSAATPLAVTDPGQLQQHRSR